MTSRNFHRLPGRRLFLKKPGFKLKYGPCRIFSKLWTSCSLGLSSLNETPHSLNFFKIQTVYTFKKTTKSDTRERKSSSILISFNNILVTLPGTWLLKFQWILALGRKVLIRIRGATARFLNKNSLQNIPLLRKEQF
jgi:hypothetical protein